MVNKSEPMYNFFKKTFTTWQHSDGRMASHVPVIGGRSKVLNELGADSSLLKADVCPYIKEAGYTQSKNVLLQAAEGLAGTEIKFPVVGTADIIMGALLDLCGYYKSGDSLIIKGL